MWDDARRNFILQQGFDVASSATCPRQYSALHFQPRTVFVWIATGILLQSPRVFYLPAAVLFSGWILSGFFRVSPVNQQGGPRAPDATLGDPASETRRR